MAAAAGSWVSGLLPQFRLQLAQPMWHPPRGGLSGRACGRPSPTASCSSGWEWACWPSSGSRTTGDTRPEFIAYPQLLNGFKHFPWRYGNHTVVLNTYVNPLLTGSEDEQKLDHYPVGTTVLVWTSALHTDQKSVWDLKLTFPCITWWPVYWSSIPLLMIVDGLNNNLDWS